MHVYYDERITKKGRGVGLRGRHSETCQDTPFKILQMVPAQGIYTYTFTQLNS